MSEPTPAPTIDAPPPRVTGFDVVRSCIGLFLLAAAGLKGYELATAPVAEEGWLTSRWFLITVVEFELYLGIWSLAGPFPRWLWRVALLSFGLFAGVSAYKIAIGADSCGCFGRVSVNPWYTLALDVVIIAALLRWRPTRAGGGTGTHSDGFRLFAVTAIFLFAGLPAWGVMSGFAAGQLGTDGRVAGNSNLVVLEPEEWIGQPFPLLEHMNVGEELAEGDWVVLFYYHDCSSCQMAVPAYEDFAERQTGTWRVALIEMPPHADADHALPRADSPCLTGRLSDAHEWFVSAPLEVVLKDGIVVSAREKAHSPPENLDAEFSSQPH